MTFYDIISFDDMAAALDYIVRDQYFSVGDRLVKLLSGWPRASFFKLSTNKFRRKGILIKEGLYCVVEVLFGRVDVLLEQFPCINFDISTWGEIE